MATLKIRFKIFKKQDSRMLRSRIFSGKALCHSIIDTSTNIGHRLIIKNLP